MRTEKASALLALALAAIASPGFAAGGGQQEGALDWQHWHADNEISNLASLQRGAAAFVNYCSGCHSLKYMRYSRLGEDLKIPAEILEANLVPAGSKPTDYVLTSMPPADAEAWFGKAPPDLSLVARSRGTDWVYQFLKTFYVDPTKPATGVDNLALPATAMPHVLSDLEGLKRAVYRNVEVPGAGGATTTEKVVEDFELAAPGRLSPAEYDAFVRDIVNFLDYVGEPSQVTRRAVGVWVVLFLLVFTGIAWLLKQEYWKDVR